VRGLERGCPLVLCFELLPVPVACLVLFVPVVYFLWTVLVAFPLVSSHRATLAYHSSVDIEVLVEVSHKHELGDEHLGR